MLDKKYRYAILISVDKFFEQNRYRLLKEVLRCILYTTKVVARIHCKTLDLYFERAAETELWILMYPRKQS